MQRLITAFSSALLLLTLMATPGVAQEFPRLDARVVDQTGTLSADDRRRAEDAFRDVEQRQGVQVFGLFVNTTGNTTVPRYAEQVAEANGLGGNDAVILVAWPTAGTRCGWGRFWTM
ncbi:MAG: TPM domain-containing protein [Chloroflexi bacterium]|nr:TPM domain-containing protein [Chloroflexota bacterium]